MQIRMPAKMTRPRAVIMVSTSIVSSVAFTQPFTVSKITQPKLKSSPNDDSYGTDRDGFSPEVRHRTSLAAFWLTRCLLTF